MTAFFRRSHFPFSISVFQETVQKQIRHKFQAEHCTKAVFRNSLLPALENYGLRHVYHFSMYWQ